MSFTDIFIKRPVLAVVVSLLILLIGLKAAFDLPIRQYPKLTNTVITITTAYPGASPDLMQGFITTPIEQAVAAPRIRRHRLHDLGLDPGPEPDLGLYQAERRSECGAH